jgi:hypothetical protein
VGRDQRRLAAVGLKAVISFQLPVFRFQAKIFHQATVAIP